MKGYRLIWRVTLWLGLGLWWMVMSSCGGTPLGIKISFADGDLLKQVTHADVYFYDASKISCAKLTTTNYKNTSGEIYAARLGKKEILFEGESRRVLLDELPEASSVVLYVVGLRVAENGEKPPIAYGCTADLSLKAGKIAKVNLIMRALN